MSLKKVHYHTIKSQEFDIILEEEESAFEIQSEISSLQHTQIELIINKVLNEFSDDRYIFRFDQIELNLGTVLKDTMQREIPLKIEEVLTHYLQNALNDYRASSEFEKIEIYDSLLEQFEHFLQYGYFNWNTYTNASATSIFNELKIENSEPLRQLLSKLGKAENIRKRIINQFLDSTIENIVEIVAEESAYILEYRTAIINHQQNERIVESDSNVFRNALWEIILAYVFLESNSYYNKKNYLEYLIKKIAEKYNQTYSSLLLALYEGVDNSRLSYRSGQNDFKKIVVELKKEDTSEEEIFEEKDILQLVNRQQLEKLLEAIFITKSALSSISFDKNNLLRLIHYYLKKDALFVQFIVTKLFKSTPIKIQFLSFLDAKTIDALFDEISQTNMLNSVTIFEKLYDNRSELPPQFQPYFLELYHQRKYFALLQIFHYSGTTESLFHVTLDHILHQIPNQKKTVLIWLAATLNSFSGRDKKIVSNYIKQRYGYNHIEQISQEIKTFVMANESETWYYWIVSNFKKWVALTDVNVSDWEVLVSNELKNHISGSSYSTVQQILKLVASEQINWQTSTTSIVVPFIRSANLSNEQTNNFMHHLAEKLEIAINTISLETHYNGKWYHQVAQLLNETAETFSLDKKLLFAKMVEYFTKSKPNELVAWRIEKLLKNTFAENIAETSPASSEQEDIRNFEFVIEKGLLPWWDHSYSWHTFNLQFTHYLHHSEYEKIIERAFKKSFFTVNLYKQLNSANQTLFFNQVLLLKIATSSQKWVKELYTFVSTEALLSGTISTIYYVDFKHQLVETLLTNSLSKSVIEKRIISLIAHLLKQASEPVSIDTKRVLQIIHQLGDSTVKKRVENHPELKKKKETHIILTEKATISNLLEFIAKASSKEIKTVLSHEKLLSVVLQSFEIRKLLISKLSSNDLLVLLSVWSKTIQFEQLSRAIIQLQVTPNIGLNKEKMSLFEDFTSQLFQSKSFLQEKDSLIENTHVNWLQQLIKHGKIRPLFESLSENKDSLSPFLIQCFENNVTREVLIDELSFKEMVTLVKNNISSNQIPFFEKALHILDFYFSYLSTQESAKINSILFGLILSKIGTQSSFQSWEIKDWLWLITYSLERTIGRTKKNQLLATIFDTKSHLIQTKKELLLFVEIAQHSDSDKLLLNKLNKKEEKPYKKLGEEIPKELLNPIYIKHAGLIILVPYLKMLFEKCQLFTPLGEFKDTQAQQKAIHLLEFAAFGYNEYHEHDLVINKVLCGMELSETINRKIVLTETEKDIVNSLLKAVTQQWIALKETSVTGLRETFLQRYGRLEEEDEQYYLKVEKKAFDMLLDQIPWNISTIKLSWMKKMLIVEWR